MSLANMPNNPAVSREVAGLDQQLAACIDPVQRAYLVRSRLSFLLGDCIQHSAKYDNADVLDLIRDVAKAFGMEFKVVRDARQRHIVHVFVKAPEETWDFRPGVPNCAQWMGYVERSHGAGRVQGG
jgi:hypothetical protein